MTSTKKWQALFMKRCPQCGEGQIYEHGTMKQSCTVCGLHFEREAGYFLGALYISYGVATIFLVSGMYLLHLLLPTWDLGWLVLIMGFFFLPFVPSVTRYSRVLWIFFDRWAWPTD